MCGRRKSGVNNSGFLLASTEKHVWNVEQAGLVCFKVVRCLAINGDNKADSIKHIHSNKAISFICTETKRTG